MTPLPPHPQPDAALRQHLAMCDALSQSLQQAQPGLPVQRIDTHISSLLLAGDTVWKLKKPLSLGFLDFRSLADRRHFCEEELRLNCRTAPQLYLGVQPVLAPPPAWRFGPDAAPGEAPPPGTVDWALRLRRFGDDQLLAHRLERGELTPADVEAMADALLAFHVGLPAATGDLGLPEVTLRWVADNLEALLRLAPSAALRQRVLALADWSSEQAARLRPGLQRRHAEGRVRECHGDTHLGNWVLQDGVPTLFDALEFNAELRWIDLAAELAFPWMDLQFHHRPDLAARLLNRWLEQGGDFDALAQLRWQAVYRALVRVKVDWLHATEAGVALDVQTAEQAAACRGLDLAEALAHPAPARLVVTWGLSGSGKSRLAQGLAERLGAVWLRSDVERKRLFGLAPTDRPGDGAVVDGVGTGTGPRTRDLYSADATRRTYARLEALAAQLLAQGWPVIVDAACLRSAERRALLAVARQVPGNQAGVRADLLYCEAPLLRLQQRITQRQAAGRDASDASVAVLQAQLGFLEPPAPDEVDPERGRASHRIDSDAPPDEVLRRALRALGLAPEVPAPA